MVRPPPGNKPGSRSHYGGIGGDKDSARTQAYADDAALVARCIARDVGAQRELFRREYPRVNATLYRVLGSDRESEDLVQDAFVEVFRSLPSFRGEARLSTWIDRIACRTAFQHLARRRTSTVQLEVVAGRAELTDPAESPERRVHAREGLRRLYEVLGGLGAETRLSLTLHLLDGRPIAEVAELTGSSQVATRVRIWRGRRALERAAAKDPVLAGYLDSSTHDDVEGDS